MTIDTIKGKDTNFHVQVEPVAVSPSPSGNTQEPKGNVCFFYGTLMVPAVLTRVLYGTSRLNDSSLKIRPAILKGWTRRRVKFADYPGITPCEGGSVRGTLVEGITNSGLKRLDTFEGSEYTLKRVNVRVVEPIDETSFDAVLSPASIDGQTSVVVKESEFEIEALTYVYTAGEDRLEQTSWDFRHFVNERLHLWAGQGSKEYAGESCVEIMQREWERRNAEVSTL